MYKRRVGQAMDPFQLSPTAMLEPPTRLPVEAKPSLLTPIFIQLHESLVYMVRILIGKTGTGGAAGPVDI